MSDNYSPRYGHRDDYGDQRSRYSEASDTEYTSRHGSHRRYPPRKYPHEGDDSAVTQKQRTSASDPNTTIGVFGFHPQTTDEDLRKLLKEKLDDFKNYTFKLIFDERTGLCKGFCFIDFECLEDAMNAKEILSYESFRGQDLKCDFSYRQITSNKPNES